MKVIPALRNVSNAHTRIAFLVVAVTKRIESFFSTQQRCNEYDFLQQENSDTILIETFHVCYNEFQSYWLSAQYISKGALLALGTFLAWETRHIKVPSLNDSKYIGFCVYNIVIVCALCVPVTFVLPPEKPTAKFIFTSVVCVFTTTLVLCILFVPKVKVKI